jgi:cell division protein FtsI (penicillin-binding protein 3)
MSTGKGIRKDIVVRVRILFFLFILIGLVLMGRILELQINQGAKYRELGKKHGTKIMKIEASRGNILAEDGRLLATSVPIYDLHVDFFAMNLESFNDSSYLLANGLNKIYPEQSISEWKQWLISGKHKKSRYALLHKSVTYEELQKIKRLPIIIQGRNKSGLIIATRYRREMPFRTLAKRTIGYIIPGVKPVGIEGAFDKILAGASGKRLMQRVAGGQLWIPINEESDIDPTHGKDIVTTLRVDVQDVAESALEKSLIANKAEHGCAIVMEVKTGKIIAIANLGLDEKTGTYFEKFNYAIGEAAEPGSTMKVASLMAGFESGDFNLNTKVNMHQGAISINGRRITDSHNTGNEGTVKDALMISSNVAIAELVNKTFSSKKTEYYDIISKFRINQPIGLEIAGEGKPYFPNPKNPSWSAQTLASTAFGYEMRITPLQLLAFYNCIANRGTYMKPYMIHEIQQFGITTDKFEPKVLGEKIFKTSSANMAIEMMRAVVDSAHGTAHDQLFNPYYSIAGKTGTAVIYDPAYKGDAGRNYRASFCGFFPADSPLYSCIVVVTRPSAGAYYAAQVAGPVFREIADVLMAHEKSKPGPSKINHNIVPNFNILGGKSSSMSSVLKNFNVQAKIEEGDFWTYDYWDTIGKVHQFKPIATKQGIVPNVLGMGLSDALFLLESKGYKVIPAGTGKVVSQSVPAGQKLSIHSTINISLR